jgi:pheromone shutdown protein TraB
MAGVTLPDMRPWGRRPLTIPPDSADAWLRLVVWELWMGMLVCAILGLGVVLILASPSRVVAASDLSPCYGPHPVTVPCERLVYQGGMLNAAFTALMGLMLIGAAAWLLWELWSATEPKPITDDFLRLLNDSFGHNWRNPFKWPWARVLLAYGFTAVGATLTVAIGLTLWAFVVASLDSVKTPTIRIDTSESFRLDQ